MKKTWIVVAVIVAVGLFAIRLMSDTNATPDESDSEAHGEGFPRQGMSSSSDLTSSTKRQDRPVPNFQRRGIERANEGELRAAKRDFQRGIDANQETAENYIMMSRIDFREQRWSEAVTHLEKAIALGADNSGTRHLLGRAHRKLGNKEEAMRQARIAIEREPNSVAVRYELIDMLTENARPEEALEEVEYALRDAGESSMLYQLAAEASMELDRRIEASEFYRLAIAQSASNPSQQEAYRKRLEEVLDPEN